MSKEKSTQSINPQPTGTPTTVIREGAIKGNNLPTYQAPPPPPPPKEKK